MLNALVRWFTDFEMQMNAVERIGHYTTMQTEKDLLEVFPEEENSIELSEDLFEWPRKGSIDFEHFEARYQPEMEPVLKDVTCHIEGAWKVGIVGRTGAGKVNCQ